MFRSRTLTLALLCLGLASGRLRADDPAPHAGKVLDAAALAARIDAALNARLTERGVKPAPRADDAEFLRRVSLDLTGRIPRVADVRAFLDDQSPDRRRRLLERLLDSPQYVTHFGNTWTAILLPTTNQQFQNLALTFKPWVEKQVRENVPYDRMARELLTAPLDFGGPPVRGSSIRFIQPPAISPYAFYQANELKPENLGEHTARLFLGIRLGCAQCHNHPFASWKREQFWQYAAFFANVQSPRLVRQVSRQLVRPLPAPNRRRIKIAGTEKVVAARFLDGAPPAFRNGVDSRRTLADWVTAPENPYFARTGANRLWAHFFGVGLIDPVDDEPTADNPISHPDLLAELSRQLVAHKYDVKYLIRAIVLSEAYQRTSAVSDPGQNDPRLFARMALEGMTPEQVFDSLVEATSYKEAAPDVSRGRRIPLAARAQFLAKFASQEKKTETQTSILQALSLMNGKFVADATSLERSTTLAAVADAPFMNTGRRIETLYLATLSRRPRPEELARCVAYVDGGGPRNNSAAALADVFWALLNSSEFILNH